MSSWHSKPLPRLFGGIGRPPRRTVPTPGGGRLRRAGPNELEPPPQAGFWDGSWSSCGTP